MSRLSDLSEQLAVGAFGDQKFRITKDAMFSEFYLELEDASVEISAGSGGNTVTVRIPKAMAEALLNAHTKEKRK